MAWRNTPPQMQEHLPHCKLFFPKSSALMVMVTPQSLQLAQPPPVPYLGVISCYRQKAIHLRVCRPASAYASTSMCTHTYTGAHTHAHTYMPLVHFTRSSGKSGKLLPGFLKCIFCSQPLSRPAWCYNFSGVVQVTCLDNSWSVSPSTRGTEYTFDYLVEKDLF